MIHIAHPPVDIKLLERIGAPFLRPTLQITYRGPRITEEVAVHYPARTEQRNEFPGSSAITIVHSSPGATGRAKYVRAWVHNLFGFPARNCQVFVERISFNGNIVESERSPLHWTDLDETFELPLIRHGYRNGHYIDICATDSVDPRFQVISQKWFKGYHRYSQSGVYEIEMTAEASTPCSFGHLLMTVRHDAEDWKNLRIEAVRSGRGLLRRW